MQWFLWIFVCCVYWRKLVTVNRMTTFFILLWQFLDIFLNLQICNKVSFLKKEIRMLFFIPDVNWIPFLGCWKCPLLSWMCPLQGQSGTSSYHHCPVKYVVLYRMLTLTISCCLWPFSWPGSQCLSPTCWLVWISSSPNTLYVSLCIFTIAHHQLVCSIFLMGLPKLDDT